MIFVIKLLLVSGKNRKFVLSAFKKRINKMIGYHLDSPYRPNGIIYSVEDWFKNKKPPEMEGSWIKEVIPEESIYWTKPNHIKGIIHPNFYEVEKNHVFPKAYLCFLENARIVNESGVVISSDNKVFDEFTIEYGKKVEENDIFKSYIDKPQIIKGCLATITSPDISGYFHWIFDSLPRLKLIAEVADKIDFLIIPCSLGKSQIDTLAFLGFPEEKLLRIKDRDNIYCEKLFVPCLPVEQRRMSKWVCDFLRDSFLPQQIMKPSRLIYISRKDALYRKIINENEVEDYLQKIGFEIIQMSGLSFLDQAKICAESRIVVGPHGAGLSNTVFCQKAKILEIFSPSYVHPIAWVIANQVGNEYHYLIGEEFSGNSPLPWRDFRVDMEQLKETLELMLGK
jgi:hypothetical protein